MNTLGSSSTIELIKKRERSMDVIDGENEKKNG